MAEKRKTRSETRHEQAEAGPSKQKTRSEQTEQAGPSKRKKIVGTNTFQLLEDHDVVSDRFWLGQWRPTTRTYTHFFFCIYH